MALLKDKLNQELRTTVNQKTSIREDLYSIISFKGSSDFDNDILGNSDTKKTRVFELILEYIEREGKHCLEL